MNKRALFCALLAVFSSVGWMAQCLYHNHYVSVNSIKMAKTEHILRRVRHIKDMIEILQELAVYTEDSMEIKGNSDNLSDKELEEMFCLAHVVSMIEGQTNHINAEIANIIKDLKGLAEEGL